MASVNKNRIGTALALLGTCLALAACETRISASATTNAPVQYSHVYVTVEQVWVNASASAGPDDTAWIESTLDDPQTIDLVGLTSGTLKEFASQLPVPTGTYNQLRLILSDTSATLAPSAQSAGAQFNNEVDYFDGSGVAQQAPLAVPNATVGVTVPIKLNVQTSSDAILAAVGSASTSTTGNTGNTGTNCVNSSTSLSGTSSSCTSSTTSTTSSTSTSTTSTTSTDTSGLGTVTATAAVVFDASRDIARFTFTDQVGFALNARLVGYDLANVGTISSQVSLTALTFDARTNRPDVQVTAETPSSDGTRNVPVLSAPMRTDGTFILYPFPTDDDSPTTYDLVIHGPGIRTIIVKSVPVQSGAPSSASTVNLNNIALVLAASTYPVNVATATPLATRGARVGFYQTLNASGELPYLIEERTVDPISGVFALDQTVPADNIAFGTFNSGQTLTLTTGTPVEGTGAYKLAASAALFGDGAFGDTLTAPTAGTTTTTNFNGPTLALPTGALSGTITATVNITTPGSFDKGAVVISHDGAIITATPLDGLLVPAQASGTLTISAIPAGDGTTAFAAGTYSAEGWVWNSSDPDGTFVRQPATGLIDLRAATAATVTLTIN
jgi:hypothetical protein